MTDSSARHATQRPWPKRSRCSGLTPSAELRPEQTDQDSLPPYELLDEILELYIIGDLGAAEIVAKGFDSDLVERIVTMVGRAEHKRRQAAPVIKVSARAFGMGRRMPIARAIYEARAGATLRRKP